MALARLYLSGSSWQWVVPDDSGYSARKPAARSSSFGKFAVLGVAAMPAALITSTTICQVAGGGGGPPPRPPRPVVAPAGVEAGGGDGGVATMPVSRFSTVTDTLWALPYSPMLFSASI